MKQVKNRPIRWLKRPDQLGLPEIAIVHGNRATGPGSTFVKIDFTNDEPLVTIIREGVVPAHDVVLVEESTLKYWKDAGHVARRTLEAMKLELTPGKTFHEVIEAAERYIHRHGGKPAFPGTIAVNDLAARFTTDHAINQVEGWDGEMVLQKGDCVKIDLVSTSRGTLLTTHLPLKSGTAMNIRNKSRRQKKHVMRH